VLVGVDNGVAPIDQMQVTVTRPIEEALNSIQGLERVQSITSRGTVEVDLVGVCLPCPSRPRWSCRRSQGSGYDHSPVRSRMNPRLLKPGVGVRRS
jgi:hypothetical protein